MEQFPYEEGFISIGKGDYDWMRENSKELSFHFERCVGTINAQYRFVFDPEGEIKWAEFLESKEFVLSNFGIMQQNPYFWQPWDRIAKALSNYDSVVVIDSEPIAMICDSSSRGGTALHLVYEEVMLSGSRSYYITKRGKLIPSSHSSHCKPIPFLKMWHEELSDLVKRANEALAEYKKLTSINIFEETEHERITAQGKVFAKEYPNAPINVIRIPHMGSFAYLENVAHSKGREYFNSNGERVGGVIYSKKDEVDYDNLIERHNKLVSAAKEAYDRYNDIEKEIEVSTTRIIRKAYSDGWNWSHVEAKTKEYTRDGI